MSTATLASSDFITSREARERLNLTSEQLCKLVRRRVLTVRQIPGLRATFLRDDVERLARESIHPAVKV